MRLKAFIIFLIIFTIAYIVFFIILDHINNKRNDPTLLLKKELDINKFYIFARFYSINTNLDIDSISNIYNLMKDTDNIKISYIAKEANVSNEEVIVVVLYLEYLNYLSEKTINTTSGMIMDFSLGDKEIFDKYINYFRNRNDYNTIINNAGSKAKDDLIYINNNYLVEGIKIVDNRIYYVGDYNV